MKILLDTQAFIWFNLNDTQLKASARNLIVDAENSISISPASYWEIAIKISRGKFEIDVHYDTFWQLGIEGNNFQILPIELQHTSQLLNMPFHHKDPFDCSGLGRTNSVG